MKHPDQEALLEETYDEMESDLQRRIEGLTHQIDLLSDCLLYTSRRVNIV